MCTDGSDLPQGIYGDGGIAKALQDERSANQFLSTSKSSSSQYNDTDPTDDTRYVAYSSPARTSSLPATPFQQFLPSPARTIPSSFPPQRQLASQHRPPPLTNEYQNDRVRQIKDFQDFSTDRLRHAPRLLQTPETSMLDHATTFKHYTGTTRF